MPAEVSLEFMFQKMLKLNSRVPIAFEYMNNSAKSLNIIKDSL